MHEYFVRRSQAVAGASGAKFAGQTTMTPHDLPRVSIVHDYLTQRGGAERVVLSMLSAFPEAELYTSLYEADATFPEFRGVRVRTSPLNRSATLRAHHRAAFPLLAPAFSLTTLESDVTLCSSSGWAHGIRTTGRKIVYCHTPARWLYPDGVYLEAGLSKSQRFFLDLTGPLLRSWDRRAAATAHRYLTNSTEVRRRIQRHYHRDAEVLPPPPTMKVTDPQRPVEGLEPGYWLCVSRLVPYKHVKAVIAAFADLPGQRLVVAGRGPQEAELRQSAPANVRLRWAGARRRAALAV